MNKNISNFSVALLHFCFRKTSEKLTFQNLFATKKTSGAYSQWNAFTYFQKICSWTRYSNAKLIKNILNFLSQFFVFAFEKQLEMLNFQYFLTSKKPFDGYFQGNAGTYFQKIFSWGRYSDAKLIKYISNIFGHTPPFLL